MLFNSHRSAVLTNAHEVVIREMRCNIPSPSSFSWTTVLKPWEVCDRRLTENVFLHYWNMQHRQRKPHHGLPASRRRCHLRCRLISDTSQHIKLQVQTSAATVVCKVRCKHFLQADIRNTRASHMWVENLDGCTQAGLRKKLLTLPPWLCTSLVCT